MPLKETAIKKLKPRSLFSGVIPLFVMAHFSHHIMTALPVPLLPMIRSAFALDYTRSGLVVSAFHLAYGLGQLPAGWLTKYTGPRLMLTISICGVAAAGIFVGLSPTYIILIVVMVLMGLLGGGYHPASTQMISEAVKPKQRGQALGLHMIGGSASFFLAPLIAAAIAATWGWRGSFIILAIPSIIFGAVFYLLLKQFQNHEENESKTPATYHDTLPESTSNRLSLATFLILFTFTHAVLYSTLAFIPLFLVDNFGITEETAAASISITYSAGLWMAPLGGYLADRWGRIKIAIVACFLSIPVVYLLNLVSYGAGTTTLLIAIGILLYTLAPASQAYIVEKTPRHLLPTILGIYFFANLEGVGVLTPVMGYLIDRFDFAACFAIASTALLIVTLLCSIVLWRCRE